MYSSRLHDRSQIFVKSITEIIRILYAQVRTLESHSLPDMAEILYEPLEELPVCMNPNGREVLTTDHLKVVYNFKENVILEKNTLVLKVIFSLETPVFKAKL